MYLLLVVGDAWVAWVWFCATCDWNETLMRPGAPATTCSCGGGITTLRFGAEA